MTVFGIRLVYYVEIFSQPFLIRNLAAHISGKKHSGKITNKEWILVETQKKEEEQEESLQLPEPVAAVEVKQV